MCCDFGTVSSKSTTQRKIINRAAVVTVCIHASIGILAPVLAPNKASMKILENCGFVLEGVHVCAVFRESEGGFLDEHMFARIRA